MYYQFFGLTKNPFSMTPDPSSLYLTTAHREAIAGLTYGAFSRKGFVVLSGEAGTGKTTLLRRLVELSKESNARCSVVFNPLLSPSEFLELLLYNFGLREMPASKTQRLLKLEELLLETHRARKTAVLIVDEAHKLSHEVFEEIRLLTNFETGEDKLLQIVLAGQPELRTVLNHPDLWQLKQRIAVRLQIDPLAARQVTSFIAYRWKRFGGADPHPFTKEAVTLVAQWSRGIPRLVNSICDNALLLAFSRQSKKVDAGDILEVARDLDLPAPLHELPLDEPEEAPPAEPVQVEVKPLIAETVAESNGHANGHTNGNGHGHVNGYSNGNGNGNGHKHVPVVKTTSAEMSVTPANALPIDSDTLVDGERVRAQAVTRPRPSVFDRSGGAARTAVPISPLGLSTPAPPPVNNASREPIRVKKLARLDAEPPQLSGLMGWLTRLGLVSLQSNSSLAPAKSARNFLTKWRKQ